MHEYHESCWIDFMEDEVDPSIRLEQELLLKHSKTDQEILKNFQALKEVLKKGSEVPMPKEDAFYNTLHNRIMLQVNLCDYLEGEGDEPNDFGPIAALTKKTLNRIKRLRRKQR